MMEPEKEDADRLRGYSSLKGTTSRSLQGGKTTTKPAASATKQSVPTSILSFTATAAPNPRPRKIKANLNQVRLPEGQLSPSC